jgi:ketosteroid isomerase-like protein
MAVLAAFDRFFAAIADQDLDAAIACFSRDPEIRLIGSESDERAIGAEAVRAFLRRVVERDEVFTLDFSERHVSYRGEVAWVYADGVAHMSSSDRAGAYRVAGVFVREDGVWRWAQYVGAEPA